MADFPPASPDHAFDNIFRKAYWKSLSDAVADPAALNVNAPTFWDAHDAAGAVDSWTDMMPLLNELDGFLRGMQNRDEPRLHMYKTKSAQALQDIYDWHNYGGLEGLRKYVYQKKYKDKSNEAIATYLSDKKLHNPLGGHIGNLTAIQGNQQDGPAILRLVMRPGAYSALFRDTGLLVFGTGARSLKHVARYLRWRAAHSYRVRKKVALGGGETVLAGWLGVKSEGGDDDQYISLAIGDNLKSKALFSILVSKCEWQTQAQGTVENRYLDHRFD